MLYLLLTAQLNVFKYAAKHGLSRIILVDRATDTPHKLRSSVSKPNLEHKPHFHAPTHITAGNKHVTNDGAIYFKGKLHHKITGDNLDRLDSSKIIGDKIHYYQNGDCVVKSLATDFEVFKLECKQSIDEYATGGGYVDRVKRTKSKMNWGCDFHIPHPGSLELSRKTQSGRIWFELHSIGGVVTVKFINFSNQSRNSLDVAEIYYNIDGECCYTALRLCEDLSVYLQCLKWLNHLITLERGAAALRGTNRIKRDIKKTQKPGKAERALNKAYKAENSFTNKAGIKITF
jgi:hypothetical protein